MSDWRVLVAETVTGQIVAEVTPTATPTFTRKIGDKGDVGVRVSVDSAPNAHVDFHTYTRPGKYSWAVLYGDHVVQAGPLWTYRFEEDTRELEVSCAGLLSLFARRVTRNPNGRKAIVHPSEDLIYSGLSLRGIMRQLVSDNIDQVYYDLPSLLLPDPEQGMQSRTYFGYELKTIAENMADLHKVDSGPEFDFAPEMTADGTKIRWRLNIGGPLLGDQSSHAVWDYGTEQAPVDALNPDVDGSAAPCSRAWTKGTGSERAMLSGFAENLAWFQQGYPATDYVDGDHTSCAVQATLDDYARANLAEFRSPTETWDCTIRIAGPGGAQYAPALGNWQLGDAVQFVLSGHPWIPSGTYRRRILGVRDDGPSTVRLELTDGPESGT